MLENCLGHWRRAKLAQLDFGQPSFATPPVDRDVKLLVQSISRRSIGGPFKKEPTYTVLLIVNGGLNLMSHEKHCNRL